MHSASPTPITTTTSKHEEEQQTSSKTKNKRYFYAVEGNISSGKTTTCKSLALLKNCFVELQNVKKWSLLNQWYISYSKSNSSPMTPELSYATQLQIAHSYLENFAKYSFDTSKPLVGGDPKAQGNNCKMDYQSCEYLHECSIDSQAQAYEIASYMKQNVHNWACVTLFSVPSTDKKHYYQVVQAVQNTLDTRSTASPTQANDNMTIEQQAKQVEADIVAHQKDPNAALHIYFEGIMSNSGVFTEKEHDEGMIQDGHYTKLRALNVIEKGVIPRIVFFLNPGFKVCKTRLLAREDENGSCISTDYLESIDIYYTSYLSKIRHMMPIVVIDNSKMEACATARLIRDISQCFEYLFAK
jgi:deoxyadenosine/deoxycytidine kinase